MLSVLLLGALLPPAHASFQLANALLLVSYLTSNVLVLRLLLAAGGICFFLWGLFVLNVSLDAVAWNGIFICINSYHAVKIMVAMFPKRLDEHRESIYQHYFGKGKIELPRHQYTVLVDDFAGEETTFENAVVDERVENHHEQQYVIPQQNPRLTVVTPPPHLQSQYSIHASLSSSSPSPSIPVTTNIPTAAAVESRLCMVRSYSAGECVAFPGEWSCRLSILLKGKVIVEKLRRGHNLTQAAMEDEAWRPLNFIRKLEFLDSPEWVARGNGFDQRSIIVSPSTSASISTLSNVHVNGTGTVSAAMLPEHQEKGRVWEVRLRCLTPCRVFSWNGARLDAVLRSNQAIENALHAVLGQDLARKVFSGNVERFVLNSKHDEEASTTLRAEVAALQRNHESDALYIDDHEHHDNNTLSSSPAASPQPSSSPPPVPTRAALENLVTLAGGFTATLTNHELSCPHSHLCTCHQSKHPRSPPVPSITTKQTQHQSTSIHEPSVSHSVSRSVRFHGSEEEELSCWESI